MLEDTNSLDGAQIITMTYHDTTVLNLSNYISQNHTIASVIFQISLFHPSLSVS